MEDEDLELLRNAALQTLHNKPKSQEAQRPVVKIQPVQKIQSLNPRAVPFIPTPAPIAPQIPAQTWNNFPPNPAIVPQPLHYVPPVVRIPAAMPLQPQSFIPNVIAAPQGVPINVPLSIVPVASAPMNVPNVQLSPRSAAFVSQNNDILMRRQHEKSPGYRSPYRNSPPSRWSPSPPRQRRHSRSKSPIPAQRSYRDKSLSPRRRDRDSPAKKNGRWKGNNSPGRRRDRSRSPRRSPFRKRSNSKSPTKRVNRNSNNVRVNEGRRPLRRTPPAGRSSNKGNDRDTGHTRGRDSSLDRKQRNGDRRQTPEKGKSRSKSRSLSPGADLAAVLEKLDEDFEIFPTTSFDDTEPEPNFTNVVVNEEPTFEPMETTTTVETTKSAADNVNEDDLLGMSDDEISLGGNDIELDDLFNSDDSESENEGRFKSGAKSNKAKSTPVIPFSKLGTSSVTSVTSELTSNDRRESNRNDERRRRGDTRRDWRDRSKPDSRKDETSKEESVLKKFKPVLEDKKRSNTPEIRVPSISSTVKFVPKDLSSSVKTQEKRTIQLKRPISSSKDDPKVKESITITTGGSLSQDKKDETAVKPGLIRSSIRARLGDKVTEKDSKPLRSIISAPSSSTSTKTVRTKITWKSEKVSISYFPLIKNVSLVFFVFLL